jgi:hypothetical protein
MSISTAIDANNPNVIYRGKFYPDLIPFEHPPAQQNLGQVLAVGNQALNPTTGLPQDATDFNLVGCVELATGIIGQGNALTLQIGKPGDILQLKGATALGSILVGNGADTEELVCPTTDTETTDTVYNWNALANGQSRVFEVSDGSVFQLGYSITITYSVTDSITGTITAISGNDVTITITSFANATPSISNLILTTTPNGAVAGNPTDPIFSLNPATTTPTPPELPVNSMILGGSCYLYSVLGDPNPTPFTITILGTNLQRPTSNTQNTPLWENPTVTPTVYAFPDGCFTSTPQIVQIQANTGGSPVAFGFPAGGSFVNQDYCGFLTGYTLPYSFGNITINSKLVLTADSTKPLGVFWGVDAQGVGTVTSVSAGNNISISGSLSAPVVNVANPLTSNLVLGSVSITGTQGQNQVGISALGLSNSFISGGLENKEEISVNSTNVVETISTTDASTYQNSAVTTCSNVSVQEIMTASNLSTTETGATTITVLPTSSIMGVGCVITGSPANTDGSVILQATPTNPAIQLSQSAPFATSYITTIDRDGILQNNSAGSGFRCRSAQDIYLQPTFGQPNPQVGVIRVPEGNDIDLSSITGSVVHTTTYGKDGMESQDFLAGSYSSQANLTQSGGQAQMFISSTSISGSTNQYLRCEATAGGNLNIEHNGSVGRNLAISTTGQLNISAPSQPISVSTGSFQTFSSARTGQISQPSFVFDSPNATAGSYPAIKIDRSVGNYSAGETLGAISMWGKDGAGSSREWSRIQTKTENVGGSNQDGTLSIFNSVNGVVSETFNFNGGQNENNTFRPLDLNNNDIRTTSGNIVLSGTLSSGVGSIELKPKDGTAGSGTGLILTGNTLLSGSAGGNSGQHLCLTINGTVYKIALLNP